MTMMAYTLETKTTVEYKHKYIMDAKEDDYLGLGGKNAISDWTDLTASQFARQNEVSILSTTKRELN